MPAEPTSVDLADLYTAPMVAELLDVPVVAVRRWLRREYLQPTCEVRRMAYLAAEEIHIARVLAELFKAGCSLAAIDRQMDELARLLPEVARPLAELPIVLEGRRLLLRRGDELVEPSGQLLLDYETDAGQTATAEDASPPCIPLTGWLESSTGAATGAEPPPAEQLRLIAADLESAGDFAMAMDVYRSLLFSGAASPEDHFLLAELLYRQGDLSAARERYSVAMELDEDYVEARANLGCLLVELGELDLAEAALRGALVQHESYADAHYHLARLLDRLDRRQEAAHHWQRFLDLAPHSPCAEEAQLRLEGPK